MGKKTPPGFQMEGLNLKNKRLKTLFQVQTKYVMHTFKIKTKRSKLWNLFGRYIKKTELKLPFS